MRIQINCLDRHCVYNHENVDKERRERREFNTAFWVDKEESWYLLLLTLQLYFRSYPNGMSTEMEWTVSEKDLEEYMEVLLVLVKECGEIISAAISSQSNVEIDEKAENLAEGNSSAILTQTDLKVTNFKKKSSKVPVPIFSNFLYIVC